LASRLVFTRLVWPNRWIGIVTMAAPILDITGLNTVFRIAGKEVSAVADLDLAIGVGETLALVGESGSGKSVTGHSIMGLLPRKLARVAGGSMQFRGKDGRTRDLATLDAEDRRRIRGNEISMVFQEPMTSLNPVYTIGDQIAEPIRVHRGESRRAAAEAAVGLLVKVGIPDPARRAGQYPHELSGGMRQRATIAMALACDPVLLFADEPTTALDVTIQAQILDLLQRLQAENGMGILFVTHNLGVVAEIGHRVAVMYAGRIVEQGPVREVFRHPRHPYTIGLLASVPRLGEATKLKRAGGRLASIPGAVPGLASIPPGCSFAPRCALALPACRAEVPALAQVEAGHTSRCIRWQEL
jgi:peptide/nickel transport system ATP-binding protein